MAYGFAALQLYNTCKWGGYSETQHSKTVEILLLFIAEDNFVLCWSPEESKQRNWKHLHILMGVQITP